jgi:hypothetical protein
MNIHDRELYDVGLIGERPKDAFREDPSKYVRWRRGVDANVAAVVGPIGRLGRGVVRLFLQMFPTKAERIQAFVLLVIAIYFGGWIVPQLFGLPDRVAVQSYAAPR